MPAAIKAARTTHTPEACARWRVRGRTRHRMRVFRWRFRAWRASGGRKRAGRSGRIVRRFAICCIAIAEGPEGLRDRPRGGTACFLDNERLGLCGVGWSRVGRGARWRGSVARSRYSPEDRGGLRSGLCGRERSPAAPEGRVSLRFGAPGAPAGDVGGAVGVPVRVPVVCDGACAFGVRGGRGVSPGGGCGSRTRPRSTGRA